MMILETNVIYNCFDCFFGCLEDYSDIDILNIENQRKNRSSKLFDFNYEKVMRHLSDLML